MENCISKILKLNPNAYGNKITTTNCLIGLMRVNKVGILAHFLAYFVFYLFEPELPATIKFFSVDSTFLFTKTNSKDIKLNNK